MEGGEGHAILGIAVVVPKTKSLVDGNSLDATDKVVVWKNTDAHLKVEVGEAPSETLEGPKESACSMVDETSGSMVEEVVESKVKW